MRDILPRPSKIDSDMWVDEAIWGHRLYDEQTPWLCFMEFLNVLNSEMEAGRAFVESVPNTLSYSPQSRLYLRNILFNNPRMAVIERQYRNDNRAQWERWKESMSNSAGIPSPDYAYLEERFPLFEDFKEVVDFLCVSTIEGENNKRWSSQFVFPFGPDCLYEDLNVRENNNTSQDRRFFARTGELLYLMLSRSGKGDELLSHLKLHVLNKNTKFNRLVAALQPKDDLSHSTFTKREGTYLPYLSLPEYETLAEDWICLFRCNIPAYDVIPYLINIMGLHMLLYSLNRAKEILGQTDKATFVTEIVAPKKTIIRELSADSFSENHNLSRFAVEHYVRSVRETDEWKVAVQANDILECRDILKEKFKWPKENKEQEFDYIETSEELFSTLFENAINRHKQHLNKFHNVWSREIGLSSRRGSRRSRYAPQDLLLKSLVLCVVPTRMEYQEFLENLYTRYGLIIGDKQAGAYIHNGRADQEAFAENAARLEQRLASMGLLKRLSDACAYVENPFATREEG
ncbi:hypothetical protein [Ferviditalea candida]|uniref:Uncharacterized protein n=1 Tax=Ferviditalea candida TaxID=3108399 RepID=A0ABU5ZNS4_9BACL|nr:hypothetical protein [Paenibacillaceae bacterium T2]